MNIKIETIYGWGWRDNTNNLPFDVPAHFNLRPKTVSDKEIVGIVEPPHHFAGIEVRLGYRGESSEVKLWNLYLEYDSRQITGFAQTKNLREKGSEKRGRSEVVQEKRTR